MTATWSEYTNFLVSKGSVESLMIVSSENGALWASSDKEKFCLRKYKAMITREDGEEEEQTVDEAANLVRLVVKNERPPQGLRINGQTKHQITRTLKDERTGLTVLYTKVRQGGACVANAGKCILIGTFNEEKNQTSFECNDSVQHLAYYLVKSVWPDGDEDPNAEPSSSGSSGSVNWSQHIEKALIASGNISSAALIDSKTSTILASSSDFELQVYEAEVAQEDGSDKMETINELTNIVNLLIQKRKTPQGLRMNKQKFQIIRSFEDESYNRLYTVYGKKSRGGATLVLGGRVIVVATFDEDKNHTSPGCNEAVGRLAKYFSEVIS